MRIVQGIACCNIIVIDSSFVSKELLNALVCAAKPIVLRIFAHGFFEFIRSPSKEFISLFRFGFDFQHPSGCRIEEFADIQRLCINERNSTFLLILRDNQRLKDERSDIHRDDGILEDIYAMIESSGFIVTPFHELIGLRREILEVQDRSFIEGTCHDKCSAFILNEFVTLCFIVIKRSK